MKNTFEIKGNIVEIHLRNKEGVVHKKAIIDLDDLDKISKFGWSYDGDRDGGDGYCKSSYTRTYMHHVILPKKDGYEVDHKDRNKLNNCKNNLRYVTHTNNCYNMSKPTTNTSGVIGVSWRKDKKKWRAHIKINRKYVHLGHFDEFDDAVAARRAAEKEHIDIKIER